MASAALLALCRSLLPLLHEELFDSDQAIVGLMAKHLAELRTFPLFFYGQHYMLGVEAWMAAPFVAIGGPTVAMVRLPLMLLNMALGAALVWQGARAGLRPRLALVAALPLVTTTPVVSLELLTALGACVEPLLYVLGLWWLRRRPAPFGVLLCIGTLHREFTVLALPAVAIADWLRRPRPSLLFFGKLGGAAIVSALVVNAIKLNVSRYGPPPGEFVAGSLTMGPATIVQWLSFRWDDCWPRLVQAAAWGLPDMLGLRRYGVADYGIPADISVGSRMATIAFAGAALVAAARLVWLAWRRAPGFGAEGSRFALYVALVALGNLVLYGLNANIAIEASPIVRYMLQVIWLPAALLMALFAVDRSTRWTTTVAVAVAIWAGLTMSDNVRLAKAFTDEPPPRHHRALADALYAEGIRHARAGYWDAYIVTFLSQERLIVASTDIVRISAYQSEVDKHADQAVLIERQPCEGRPVDVWCVSGPPAR